MIVVDSSALVAILESESNAEHFSRLFTMPHAASPETAIETVPFAEPYVSRALEAYARFGKGIHAKARLNLGDCASCALAKSLDAPLLFKGDDFNKTDIRPYA